jgi:hypothetical protein
MHRPATSIVVVVLTVMAAGIGDGLSGQDKKPVRVPLIVEKGLKDALTAYESGDDDAVARWMKTGAGHSDYRYADAVLAEPAPWSRARAAFVLEVAVGYGPRNSTLFAAARSMVMGRPAPLGADPVEDRFEILLHQTAIGALQSHSRVKLLADYVDAVSPRFEEARRRGIALETRIPLARAFISALLCCWKGVPGEIVRSFRDISRSDATVNVAVRQFEEAARDPALRSEALIRGAKLLFDNARKPEALALIERVPEHTDPALGYVHHWIHARLLDTTDRPADAAAAYRRALTFAPQSQPAAIGLAAALLRAGNAEESAKAAADARAIQVAMSPAQISSTAFVIAPGDFSHMMSTFNRGDHRFIPQWLAEVRRLRR